MLQYLIGKADTFSRPSSHIRATSFYPCFPNRFLHNFLDSCFLIENFKQFIRNDGLIRITYSPDPIDTYRYGGTDFRCHTKWNNGKEPEGKSISSLHKGDMVVIYGKINTVGKITRKVLEEKGIFEDTYMIYTIGDGYDIHVTRIE